MSTRELFFEKKKNTSLKKKQNTRVKSETYL